MTKTGGVSLFTLDGNKVIIFLVVFLTGCSVTNNLEEIKRLQAVGDSQEQIQNDVEAQDQVFAQMLNAYEFNQLADYKTKQQIVGAFGKPLGRWDINEGDLSTKWLYRQSANFFHSDKLYLYFDQDDQLRKIEFVPAS